MPGGIGIAKQIEHIRDTAEGDIAAIVAVEGTVNEKPGTRDIGEAVVVGEYCGERLSGAATGVRGEPGDNRRGGGGKWGPGTGRDPAGREVSGIER